MQKHTKIYFDFFDVEYDPFTGQHNCKSELSGLPAQDIHHIEARGMGGGKTADRIENLMALTREEHEKYGDKKQYKAMLKRVHNRHIERIAKNKFK
jgi:hypothetical protein